VTKVEPISGEELAAAIATIDATPEHKEILFRSVKNSSHLWIGTNDETILCFFGLIPPTLLSDTAYLWLYCTADMQGHTIPLIRHSKRAAKKWLELYDCIVGHGHVDKPRSLAWLRMIGAKFGEPQGSVVPFEIRAG
jgi:hypothetical protein